MSISKIITKYNSGIVLSGVTFKFPLISNVAIGNEVAIPTYVKSSSNNS